MTNSHRMLLLVTGSVAAAFVPYHVAWLRGHHPDVELKIVLTRSATTFVAPAALAALSGSAINVDDWSEYPDGAAPHVDWSKWSDSAVIYPAGLGCVGRLAHGAADTPAMLALQITSAPIVIAPTLPPGGLACHAYATAMELLGERPRVTIVPPVPGRSTATGELEAHAAAAFSTVTETALEAAVRWRA